MPMRHSDQNFLLQHLGKVEDAVEVLKATEDLEARRNGEALASVLGYSYVTRNLMEFMDSVIFRLHRDNSRIAMSNADFRRWLETARARCLHPSPVTYEAVAGDGKRYDITNCASCQRQVKKVAKQESHA